jgi:hypothetical protein
MANIWEKDISIFAGNSNSGLSYLITTVPKGMEVSSIIPKKEVSLISALAPKKWLNQKIKCTIILVY